VKKIADILSTDEDLKRIISGDSKTCKGIAYSKDESNDGQSISGNTAISEQAVEKRQDGGRFIERHNLESRVMAMAVNGCTSETIAEKLNEEFEDSKLNKSHIENFLKRAPKLMAKVVQNRRDLLEKFASNELDTIENIKACIGFIWNLIFQSQEKGDIGNVYRGFDVMYKYQALNAQINKLIGGDNTTINLYMTQLKDIVISGVKEAQIDKQDKITILRSISRLFDSRLPELQNRLGQTTQKS